jgi:hypothetical protein
VIGRGTVRACRLSHTIVQEAFGHSYSSQLAVESSLTGDQRSSATGACVPSLWRLVEVIGVLRARLAGRRGGSGGRSVAVRRRFSRQLRLNRLAWLQPFAKLYEEAGPRRPPWTRARVHCRAVLRSPCLYASESLNNPTSGRPAHLARPQDTPAPLKRGASTGVRPTSVGGLRRRRRRPGRAGGPWGARPPQLGEQRYNGPNLMRRRAGWCC